MGGGAGGEVDAAFLMVGEGLDGIAEQVGEAVGKRALISPDGRQVVVEPRGNTNSVAFTRRKRQLDALVERFPDIERAEFDFGGMREFIDLVDDRVAAIDFGGDQFAELGSKYGFLLTLRKELREGLDRDERIAVFMGHPRGEIVPERRALHRVLLFLQRALRGDALDHPAHHRGDIADMVERAREVSKRLRGIESIRTSGPCGNVGRPAPGFGAQVFIIRAQRGMFDRAGDEARKPMMLRAGDPFGDTVRALKQVFDPNGIIAPGRYNLVWRSPNTQTFFLCFP